MALVTGDSTDDEPYDEQRRTYFHDYHLPGGLAAVSRGSSMAS